MNTSEPQLRNFSGNQGPSVELHKLIGTAVHSTIAIVGTMANLLLVTALIKDPLKIFKTSSSTFILNIAVVDFIVSLSTTIRTPLQFAIPSYGLSIGHMIIESVSIGAMTISPWSFLSLSIERFCSVAFPLWYRVHFTVRTCRYWLCTMWLFHLTFEALTRRERYTIRFTYTALSFLCTIVFYLGTYSSLKDQTRKLLRRQDVSELTFRTIKSRLENEKRFLFTIGITCFILVLTVLPGLCLLTFNAFSNGFFTATAKQSLVID